MLSLQDYALLAMTTTLECLWAAFYASGEPRYIARIMAMGQHWADFADLPDAVQYLSSIQKPLPAEFTVRRACSLRGSLSLPLEVRCRGDAVCAGAGEAAGGGPAQRTRPRIACRHLVPAAERAAAPE